jgi:hypothetical protein
VTSVTGVLAGAKGRLLPPSIPFRFFAAAALFHVALWVVLIRDADQVISFRGGVAPTLAALHLLVLGILTTTAIGAAAQLLPVATRRALAAFWLVKLVFWMFVPGLVLLTVAMYTGHIALLITGAALSTVGLLLFAGLLGDNLRKAGSLPVVAAYGWAALAALLGVAALGLALSADFAAGFLPNHFALAHVHMILGAFGFMGLLVLGFSHILVPMFALAPAPAKRPAFAGFAAAAAAVAIGALGAWIESSDVMTLAICVGLVAAGLHLSLMRRVMQNGMRRRLGLSFILVRAAWVALPLTLGAGLATIHERAGPNGPALFGLLLLGGWLLTFLLGILQRILPFLASMHVAPAERDGLPQLSQLGTSAPLKLHAICHGSALLGLTLAIALNVGSVARVASTIGLVGALSFALFTADVLRRLGPRGRRGTAAHPP